MSCFAVGSVTAAICGLYAVSEFGISAAVVVITAAVCAAAILLLYRIFMRTDRKLRKMWEYVGSPDEAAVSGILGRAERLGANDDLVLIADDMILNFRTLHAYRLTDISGLFRTSYDDDGTVFSYVVGVVCEGSPFGTDKLSFETEKEREAALFTIFEACKNVGNTALSMDEKI